MPKGNSPREDLLKDLKDPKFVAHYIQAVIEENDPDFFVQAIAEVVKIHGFAEIAEKTGIARQSLYQMTSEDGNPTIKNVNKILDQLGLELTVRPKKTS